MCRCYLIVVFQARPMELWDVDTLSLLKVLHSIQIFFPVVVRKNTHNTTQAVVPVVQLYD